MNELSASGPARQVISKTGFLANLMRVSCPLPNIHWCVKSSTSSAIYGHKQGSSISQNKYFAIIYSLPAD